MRVDTDFCRRAPIRCSSACEQSRRLVHGDRRGDEEAGLDGTAGELIDGAGDGGATERSFNRQLSQGYSSHVDQAGCAGEVGEHDASPELDEVERANREAHRAG